MDRGVKCIFCKHLKPLENFSAVIRHYLTDHNIDINNVILLQYLLTLKAQPDKIVSSCLICDKIFGSNRHRWRHMLRRHAQVGGSNILRILPVETDQDYIHLIDKNVYTVSIFKDDHGDEYEWDGTDIIDTFLHTAKIALDFMRLQKDKKFINISLTFSIVNSVTIGGTVTYLPLKIWSTSAYKTVSINPNILRNLQTEVMDKVLMGGESGSSAKFAYFKSFKISASDANDADVVAIFGGDDSIAKANMGRKTVIVEVRCFLISYYFLKRACNVQMFDGCFITIICMLSCSF